jgi:chromosome segregation ATPase
MDSKSRNCASCTRRGRKCEKRFHSAVEWAKLEKEENQIKSDLERAEIQLEKAMEAQQKLFAKIRRLRKQQQFLKERGSKMLDHDTNVMDVLDEEDPEGIPPSTPPEGRELNATLDNFPALGFSNPPLPTDFSFSDLLALDEAALQRSR